MKRFLCTLIALLFIYTNAAVSFADEYKAMQSTLNNNVYIAGNLGSAHGGETVTIRLYDGDETAYIREIEIGPDGSYSIKFPYNGDATKLSFDAKLNGTNVNTSVMTAQVNESSFVSADVYITNENGGGLMIGSDTQRTVYTTVEGSSYNPEISIEPSSKAGVVIYPKNELGGDDTEYTVIIAQYDDNACLTDCDVLKTDTLSYDDYRNMSGINCGEVAINENTKSVKAFLIDSFTNIMPYSDVADGQLEKTNLHIIAASTYQDWDWYEVYPMAGIGSFLKDYFNSDYITVYNRAVSGSSAQSWLDDNPALGNWSAVLPQIKEGDYVYISLGINDLISSQDASHVDSFRSGLTKIVEDIKNKGATPILGSPALNSYPNKSGYVEISDYIRTAIDIEKEISLKEGICYIPVAETAYERMKGLTTEQALKLYHLDYSEIISDWGLTEQQLANNKNASLKKGEDDGLHLNARGADMYASLVKAALQSSDSKLRFYLR